ncbi:hypothetical protein M407DRAFT_22654 [Tulasnella calospora MUT 4182]|uniref:Protein kinase domain-containing protein n=1 Tax=Tulasnella calospora MUT 4182 TaxID=1051891 RepID=A0A0C3QC20_9AGAM|nr:hypothetical protein M407DRAFT_22654 [Tulasnella calospora MUT 4182]
MDPSSVRADDASAIERTTIAKEKLGKLTHIRIHPARVVIPESNRVRRGGYASVAVATLLPLEKSDRLPYGPGDDTSSLSTKDGTHVAVKRLTILDNTDLSGLLRAFVREIGIVASIRHPNIVRLLGFVEDIQGRIAWMIFPWEANGNIREFLSSRRLTVPERISLINDVVTGVEYLHSREPPIWHGDLKSLNILVNDEGGAVVTDFGSARVLSDRDTKRPNSEPVSLFEPTPIPDDDNGFTGSERPELITVLRALTGPAWSTRWASPERLNGQSPDLPSDIWALGWVCWEVMTDSLPFHGISNDANIILRVVTGKLPPIGENEHMAQIRALCGLLLDCWNPDPNRRPTASDCLRIISYMPMSVPPRSSQDDDTSISSFALLMALGQMHLRQSNQSTALQMLQHALDIARANAEEPRIAAALNGIGEIKILLNKPLEATSFYEEALDLSSRAGDDWEQANALHGLGRVYAQQDRIEEAISAHTDAKTVCVRIGNHLGEANALNRLGGLYVREQQYTEATSAYEAAKEIFNSIQNEQGKGASACGLGDVYSFQGRFEEAIPMYEEAREIFSRIGEDRGAGKATNYLAAVYRSQTRYSEAISEYEKALNIFSGMQGGEFGKLEALMGLGGIYKKQGQYQKTASTYNGILNIYAALGDQRGRAKAMIKLATVYRQQSRHSEAGPLFVEAEQICISLQDWVGKAKATRGLGLTLISEQRYAEAMPPLNDALLIFQLYGLSEAAAECTAILQRLDSQLASAQVE